MFNFFKRKKKVSSQQMAEGLWMFCKKFSKKFQNNDLILIIENANIKLDDRLKVNLVFEIIKMNLWIISKALAVDKEILKELHKIYIFGHANLAETEEDKINFPKQAEKELHETYKKYYEAWDDNSGGNQSVLALTILEQLLNDGKPSRKLINAELSFFVITHVLTMLKAVLNFRDNFEIKK